MTPDPTIEAIVEVARKRYHAGGPIVVSCFAEEGKQLWRCRFHCDGIAHTVFAATLPAMLAKMKGAEDAK